MIRCSRPMSCAEAASSPSGGRRSTKRCPVVSSTRKVRFECPPATTSNRSGGRTPTTCCSNHAVTPATSIPLPPAVAGRVEVTGSTVGSGLPTGSADELVRVAVAGDELLVLHDDGNHAHVGHLVGLALVVADPREQPVERLVVEAVQAGED